MSLDTNIIVKCYTEEQVLSLIKDYYLKYSDEDYEEMMYYIDIFGVVGLRINDGGSYSDIEFYKKNNYFIVDLFKKD